MRRRRSNEVRSVWATQSTHIRCPQHRAAAPRAEQPGIAQRRARPALFAKRERRKREAAFWHTGMVLNREHTLARPSNPTFMEVMGTPPRSLTHLEPNSWEVPLTGITKCVYAARCACGVVHTRCTLSATSEIHRLVRLRHAFKWLSRCRVPLKRLRTHPRQANTREAYPKPRAPIASRAASAASSR